MPVITLYPTTAAHDGYESATTGTTDTAATQIPFGKYGGANNYTYFKFPLPSTGWLSGKVVSSLMLTFRSADTQAGGTNTKCYMEKVASPADVVAGVANTNISARMASKTTASISFSSTSWGSWNAGQDYSYYGNALSPATPSSYFTTLLDEVVTAVGAGSMTALGFIWETTSGSFYRLPYAYGGASVPSLTITYTELPTIDFETNLKTYFEFETNL